LPVSGKCSSGMYPHLRVVCFGLRVFVWDSLVVKGRLSLYCNVPW
jgi:hypothetical protein